MRILHIVSGIAPDQRFGGSSRVALDLARRQQRRGHVVHLLSSDVGFTHPVPRHVEGVRVTLLRSVHPAPALGFGTIVSPGLAIAVLRLLDGVDVVHVHLAREFNTLIAAALTQLARVPIVVQTHGMLDAPSNAVARVVDVLLGSPVLRRARTVLTLTADEDAEVARLSRGRVSGTHFPNGIDLRRGSDDGPRSTVLFLARLHPRKGARAFAEAAVRLAPDRPDLDFALVGPDEGDGPVVRAVIEESRQEDRVRYVGGAAHSEVPRLMATAALYCLPAAGEPFGLTILEAMAASTPVLVHGSAELAGDIVAAGAGWAFGAESPVDLEGALRSALEDPVELRRRGGVARVLVEERFGIDGVLDRLDDVYVDAVGSGRG